MIDQNKILMESIVDIRYSRHAENGIKFEELLKNAIFFLSIASRMITIAVMLI